jgi:hypothetical protein
MENRFNRIHAKKAEKFRPVSRVFPPQFCGISAEIRARDDPLFAASRASARRA